MQAQGYWIFDNWQIFEITSDERARSIALECTDSIIELQRPAGFWEYPNREWRDRIATVEGCFASLGLLESYQRVRDQRYLDAAHRWFEFLMKEVGFRKQTRDSMWAVNYFAHRPGDGGGVPNNSTLLLWFLARMYEFTGDSGYLEPCEKTINWLSHVQLPTGELPYALSSDPARDRIHFLCFQYNAFEFMDLVHYFRITGDQSVWSIISRLADYLATGINHDGTARFDCGHDSPDVLYYAIAIARALSLATELKLGDYQPQSELAFGHALSHQREDGGFQYHSRQNYGVLTDRRSYPRYLAMILHHLLLQCRASQAACVSETEKSNDGAHV